MALAGVFVVVFQNLNVKKWFLDLSPVAQMKLWLYQVKYKVLSHG